MWFGDTALVVRPTDAMSMIDAHPGDTLYFRDFGHLQDGDLFLTDDDGRCSISAFDADAAEVPEFPRVLIGHLRTTGSSVPARGEPAMA
ncbi:hypothetical protein ACFSC4_20600 [Deinococcus malanensis]|uniref:hypothetical protein n=1 Tax=Deinococcus malanensis TaxID=1706855 RepID=UPI003624D524